MAEKMDFNPDYLYPGKALLLKERHEKLISNQHELRCEIIKEGTIIPPPESSGNDCVVIDKNEKIVDISCYDCDIDYSSEYLQELSSRSVRIDEKVFFAGYFNSHWGHFIMETITRLWPLFSSKNDIDCRIVYCLHKNEKANLSGNIKEVLRLLNVLDKIQFISSPTKFREIIVGETAVYPRAIFSPEAKFVYDKIIKASKSSVSQDLKFEKKIYLSRSKFKKAVKNEAGLQWIDQWMESNGYHIIYPEKMDFRSMVSILQEADEVCAISGTLPHNMVFAKENTRLIILEKYPTLNNYQPGINLLFNHNVTHIDCGAFIRPVSPGLGPFILFPSTQLLNYVENNNLIPPPPFTKREKKKALRLYFRLFKRNYYQEWIMPHWLIEEVGICCNAYQETVKIFGPWLNGSKALFYFDYINPNRVKNLLKKFIKRMLKSIKH